jgi:hypothetical protein
MPNGFVGSIEEWAQMEAPFLTIDDRLSRFAVDQNMELVKNYHNLPRRDLLWERGGVYRKIQLFPADRPGTYHVALIAWKDKSDGRYGQDRWLKKWLTWPEVTAGIDQWLEEGMTILESWSENDLELVS